MPRGAAPISSFPPQIAAGCRVLILGTVPSARSLALQQSYGHPQNLFWPLMGEMLNAGPDLAYAERIKRLHAVGIGIWDVLKQCERSGSLDSSIVRASEVPNNIAELLREYPDICAIALNGTKANTAFAHHIVPTLAVERLSKLEIVALPSTSPANASMSRAVKRKRWGVLLKWVK